MDATDDDLWLERRRRRKRESARRRRVILLICSTLAAAAVAVVAVGAAVRARGKPGESGVVARPLGGGPSASSEGEKWTHRELVEYLRSRGVMVYAEQTNTGSAYGPACDVIIDGGGQAVYVQKRQTAQEAADQAGAAGGLAFAWGRFYFRDYAHSPELAERMRAALP